MQLPLQFQFLREKFYFHFIFETLAFVVGIRVYYFLRKKSTDHISDLNRLYILLGAMLGALLGSRIIAAFEMPRDISHLTWLTFYASKTVLGGFLGGLLGVEIIKKCIGEKKSSGDIYVVPILIALFIGRIGCFSMGIAEPTFGVETTFFTGMNLGDGKFRHPVMLYEMFFCLLYLIVILTKNPVSSIALQSGERFKIFMLLYASFRFGMEYIKPYEPIFLGLSIIHGCGIFIYLYYSKFIIKKIYNAK